MTIQNLPPEKRGNYRRRKLSGRDAITKLAERSQSVTSRASTGREFFLDRDIDERSTVVRRLKDITATIVNDLGGPDRLSEQQFAIIRNLAVLQVYSEAMECDLFKHPHLEEYKKWDIETYLNVLSARVKAGRLLGIRRVPRELETTSTVEEFIEANVADEE